jgi:hypothetical protein
VHWLEDVLHIKNSEDWRTVSYLNLRRYGAHAAMLKVGGEFTFLQAKHCKNVFWTTNLFVGIRGLLSTAYPDQDWSFVDDNIPTGAGGTT